MENVFPLDYVLYLEVLSSWYCKVFAEVLDSRDKVCTTQW